MALPSISELLIILPLFILFIFFIKKTFSTLISLIWISVISGLFPIVMNYAFGWPTPLDLEIILFYMGVGVGLYLLYLFGKFVYSLLAAAEKFGSMFIKKTKKKVKEEKE
jgi:uncharacterized membrane protein